jgi:hypothetical protein
MLRNATKQDTSLKRLLEAAGPAESMGFTLVRALFVIPFAQIQFRSLRHRDLGCFPILSRPTPIHSTKPKSGYSPGQRHEEADGQCSGHACSLGQQIQRHNRQSESRKRDEGAGHDQDRLLSAVAALHDPADRHEGNGEQHRDPGDRAAHRLACRDDNGDERTRADRPQQEFAAICHSMQPLQ